MDRDHRAVVLLSTTPLALFRNVVLCLPPNEVHDYAYRLACMPSTPFRFPSAPSVLALPLQVLWDLGLNSNKHHALTSSSGGTGSGGTLGEGQLRMLGVLLLAEFSALKQQAEVLVGGGLAGAAQIWEQQQQQQEQQQQQQQEVFGLGLQQALPLSGSAGAEVHPHAAPSLDAGPPASVVKTGVDTAALLLGRLQVLTSLPYVPVEVLKMGVGKSSGELKRMCERDLAATHPQVRGMSVLVLICMSVCSCACRRFVSCLGSTQIGAVIYGGSA